MTTQASFNAFHMTFSLKLTQHTLLTAKGNGQALTALQIVCIILILTKATVNGNQW